MGANVQPQFLTIANHGGSNPGAAVTAAWAESAAGFVVGTSGFLIFTAGANDSYVDFVRWLPEATVANTTTTATVGRIYLSSVGSGTTTTANTRLIAEVTLPAVSAANSSTPNNPIDVPIGARIKTGYFLYATNHAAPAANTNWVALPWGGDY